MTQRAVLSPGFDNHSIDDAASTCSSVSAAGVVISTGQPLPPGSRHTSIPGGGAAAPGSSGAQPSTSGGGSGGGSGEVTSSRSGHVTELSFKSKHARQPSAAQSILSSVVPGKSGESASSAAHAAATPTVAGERAGMTEGGGGGGGGAGEGGGSKGGSASPSPMKPGRAVTKLPFGLQKYLPPPGDDPNAPMDARMRWLTLVCCCCMPRAGLASGTLLTESMRLNNSSVPTAAPPTQSQSQRQQAKVRKHELY